MTQEHALRLQEIFDEMYPQFPNLVRVITYKSEYRGQLVKNFKHEDLPRIAISVDMLDTGIDIPEVVNLVFMKPVHSRIKLEQMLGRGTRSNAACRYPERLPGGIKREFLVIDFWENDFNKAPEEARAQELPVLVSLFNTRLRLLETYLDEQEDPDCQQVIGDLRTQIGRIPKDSFSVRRVLPEIEEAFTDAFWGYLVPSKVDFLPPEGRSAAAPGPGCGCASRNLPAQNRALEAGPAHRQGSDRASAVHCRRCRQPARFCRSGSGAVPTRQTMHTQQPGPGEAVLSSA